MLIVMVKPFGCITASAKQHDNHIYVTHFDNDESAATQESYSKVYFRHRLTCASSNHVSIAL